MDYLPGPDANYQAWVANFVAYANANLAALGLVAGDMTPVTTSQTSFTSSFTAHITAKAAAQAAKQNKDEARRNLTGAIRPLVRRLQASTLVSDAEKAALGITVPADGGPIGPPTTRPIVSVALGQRLQHTLNFVDENTPTRRARPHGVIGVEIWAKVGIAPPAGESDLAFRGIDSATPAVINFTSEDGTKIAYYWTWWVIGTGERGPWSEQVSATIAA